MILTEKWNIVFCFIFTFLCGILLGNNPQQKYADSLFLEEQYEKAALEYERLVFQNPNNDSIQYLALMKKAESLKRIEEYTRAIESYNRINIFSLSNEQQRTFYLKKALVQIVNENYAQAKFSLLSLTNIEPKNRQANVLLCLTDSYLQNWDDAKTRLNNLERSDSTTDSLNQLLALPPEMKSEDVAYVLSFVPGVNIAYAGEPMEGLLNFSLNAVPLALGVYGVLEGYYITGYLGAAITIDKFYFGGRNRGDYLVKRHNYRKALTYNEKLKPLWLKLLQ